MTETIPTKLKDALQAVNLEGPVPLEEADLSKNVIYWREYGVFYLWGSGSHPVAMELFYDWIHRTSDDIDEWWLPMDRCQISMGAEECADWFLLNTPGTCYRSSQSDEFIAGRPEYITRYETARFKNLRFLKDETFW